MQTTAPHSSTLDLTPIRAIYPFTPQRFAVAGGTLSYLDEGQGRPVVMVHGNPTWSFYYRRLVLALRGHRRVIVPDHLGCGLSDKPQDYPYTLANHVNNLGQLIEHLGLDHVDLVVHDWGGAIGMGWATQNPERVGRIIVMNTAAFLSPRLPFRIAVCRYPMIGDLGVRGLNGFAVAATVMATAQGLDPEVRQGLLLPYNSWANRVAIQRFVRDIPMHPSHPTWALIDAIDRDLANLRTKPMLILWGGQDWCFSDYFLAGWLARFPAAQAVRYDYAGHYVLEDAHAELIPRAVQFLG
ncbi:MAG: alpha/beta fold hydrolase [Oscillochloridaceae bacterium umkhey_bin13]